MIRIYFFVVLLFSVSYSEVDIPSDSCALIVASRETKHDVQQYIKNEINNKKYVTVYKSSNGWYAIALGFLKDSQVSSLMNSWKNNGKIPTDSFCTKGKRFTNEVYISLYTNFNEETSNVSYQQQNKSNNSDKDRTRICLAKTWGPDVCSHKFNEFAKKELNTEVNDMINSPICATLISEALNEPVTESDIQIAITTGALDEIGHAGINSDNILYNIVGGVAHLYSFSIKLDVYNDCMSQ